MVNIFVLKGQEIHLKFPTKVVFIITITTVVSLLLLFNPSLGTSCTFHCCPLRTVPSCEQIRANPLGTL